MKRREFLRKGLALGATALLPGVRLPASGGLLPSLLTSALPVEPMNAVQTPLTKVESSFFYHKNWYYTDNDGQIRGSVTVEQLKDLVRQGAITSKTVIVQEYAETNASRFETVSDDFVNDTGVNFVQFMKDEASVQSELTESLTEENVAAIGQG